MIGCYCYIDKSNIRLFDLINLVKELFKIVVKMEYKGLAIIDYEVFLVYLDVIWIVREMKKKGDMLEDFKLILGNEVYLVDFLEEVRDNYKLGVIKFLYFLMLVIDLKGYE